MNCPHCKEAKLLLSERKGIEIDYCPDCRGIWLDRGELDKLLEKSREEEAPLKRDAHFQPREEERHRHDDDKYEKHDKYRYKRRKSFLEELFD